MLDYMQSGYNKAIVWHTNHPVLTIGGSIITIILALVIFKTSIGQKFFPYAERNQFVVELWMPTGTKLEKQTNRLPKLKI
ncbi:MAG: hypothetical protein AB7S54_00745 [Bacteroidales bacterium]